jgi:hypothetical protein
VSSFSAQSSLGCSAEAWAELVALRTGAYFRLVALRPLRASHDHGARHFLHKLATDASVQELPHGAVPARACDPAVATPFRGLRDQLVGWVAVTNLRIRFDAPLMEEVVGDRDVLGRMPYDRATR